MIAIAITVIVLGIVVPLAGSDSLLSKLLELWPSYLAYVISFLTIGGFWFNHHTIDKFNFNHIVISEYKCCVWFNHKPNCCIDNKASFYSEHNHLVRSHYLTDCFV